MKNKGFSKLVLLVIVLLQASLLSAQKFQGVATYHSAAKLNVQFAGADGNDAITEDLKKQLNKQMQKEYTLKFNLTQSTWQEVESLDGDQPSAASAGGNVVITMGGAGNGILYKNTADGNFEQEENIFGKPFLVKDELTPYEWKLTGETKKIGSYNAQKAVYERTVTRRSFAIMSGDVEEEESSLKEVQDTLKVVAWFTPDIPVSHGPEDYWGLPGLILEVNDGTTTMVCSKVVLNPEEAVELKMPSKGKVVSRKEYQEIQEAKMQEMMKKYSGNGGATFRIGSGGNH